MSLSSGGGQIVSLTSGRHSKYGEFQGYYDLMISVLMQAVEDYVKGDAAEKKEAARYLNDKEDRGLLSFLSICSYFQLDINQLRAGIALLERPHAPTAE